MISLYFSISSSIIFIAILKNDLLLSSLKKDNFKFHSENFVENIKNILDESEIELSSVNSIYFTSTPSSQTGIRVSLSFVSAIKVLNPKIFLYHIDTLFFQACEETCISTLSISMNNENTNIFISVYKEKEIIYSEKINRIDLWKVKEKFGIYYEKRDLLELNFFDNFQKMKKYFKKLKDIEEIKY